MVSKREAIRRAFLDVGQSGALSFNKRQLLTAAQKFNEKVTRTDVTTFLERDSHTYSKHRKPPEISSARDFLPYKTTNQNIYMHCDLMFHKGSSDASNLMPGLVCADTFSGRVMAKKLSDKQPSTVAKAFMHMMQQQNHSNMPKKLFTDQD